MLASSTIYSSALKMEAICPSETLLGFHQTAPSFIPADSKIAARISIY
jgi:hypothetical protein